MEFLDVVDESGNPTGETVSRSDAHRKGIAHRTSHVWIIRRINDRVQILLQKRSMQKESFPGKYDTSSAGHIPAGFEPVGSALRELEEELGIRAEREQLGTVLKLNPILLTIKTYRYTIAISTLKKDLLWLIRITMLMR